MPPNEGGRPLLPAATGTCAQCATEHGPDDPHNFQSIFWGMRFKMAHGRDPTHADCVAHLPASIQEAYRKILPKFGVDWTEPKGDPISEPYSVSE